MAAIGKLLEILHQNDAPADLLQWLHKEEVQEGLKSLVGILADGVLEVGHVTRGLQRWSNSQLQAILYITQAVVAACHSLRDEEKSLIARIFELAVEFCICYLESYAMNWPALDQQVTVLQLLEMTVMDGRARELALTMSHLHNLQECVTACCDFGSQKCDTDLERTSKGWHLKSVQKGLPAKGNEFLDASCSEFQNKDFSLLPGLPDDVALQCVARVPRVHHCTLRAVSKSWCQSIDSTEFVEQRQMLGCSEDWLYLHIGTSPHLDERSEGKRIRWQLVGGYSQWHALDPQRYRWYALPPIPYDRVLTGGQVVLGAASAVLHGKLYAIGGAPFGRAAIRDVWVYDPRKNKWRKAASMSTPRFGCLVGVIDNKLYVVGGSGMCHLTGYSLPCLEVFDPITNMWKYAASARGSVTGHPFNPLKHAAVVNGKFCVTGPQNITGHMNGGMYDPATDSWSDIKPGLRDGWGRPSTVMDGKLYAIDFGCYKQYIPEDDCWVPVKCQTEDLLWGWDPRLVLAMSSSREKIYLVGTMGSALIVMIVPVKNGKISQCIRWHTMKLPNGIDFLGDLGHCSCQIMGY